MRKLGLYFTLMVTSLCALADSDDPPLQDPEKIDFRLPNANRFLFGYASDSLYFRKSYYDYPRDVSTDFKGYAITYQRDMGRDFTLAVAFSESKATGVFRTALVSLTSSVFGAAMHSRSGMRVYSGVGLVAYQLYDFPKQLEPIYPEVAPEYETRTLSVQFPLGFQYEKANYVFDASTVVRMSGPARAWLLEADSLPFTLQVGYRY